MQRYNDLWGEERNDGGAHVLVLDLQHDTPVDKEFDHIVLRAVLLNDVLDLSNSINTEITREGGMHV